MRHDVSGDGSRMAPSHAASESLGLCPEWLAGLLHFAGLALLALLLGNLLGSVTALASPQTATVIPEAMVENPFWPASGTLLLQQQDGRALSLQLQTAVQMQVSGLVNRVTVTQHYSNDSDQWLHGRYLFPLPENAAVDSMQLRIGERTIEGQIQPKAEAIQHYQQALREGRQASLMTQQRPNLFTAEVANLAPGAALSLSFTYQQPLQYRDGRFSLSFPMTYTPRYIPASLLNSEQELADAAAINGRFICADLGETAAAMSPTHSLAAENSRDMHSTTIDVTLDSPLGIVGLDSGALPLQQERGNGHLRLHMPATAPDRDFVLSWQVPSAAEPKAALYRQLGQTHPPVVSADGAMAVDRYGLLLLMPPAQPTATMPPRQLVLVVDTSGSMAGQAMEQARRALNFALESLRPEDSFNIIAFSSHVDQLAAQALAATPANIAYAKRFSRSLEADGGTEMVPALQRALPMPQAATSIPKSPAAVVQGRDFLPSDGDNTQRSDGDSLWPSNPHRDDAPQADFPSAEQAASAARLRQVIFITDGAVGNESELLQLISRRLGDSRLFTVGIGSAPNRYFMEAAATMGRGSFTYISQQQQVEQQMVTLLAKLSAPVMTDVTVRYQDGTVPDYWPKRIPDLYQGEPIQLSLRESNAEHGALWVMGTLAGQAWQQPVLTSQDTAARGLDLIWAQRQIAALQQPLAMVEDDSIAKRITALALQYHLVSQYTSLVAVDVTPVNAAANHTPTAELPNLMPAGWQAPGTMPQTSSNSRLFLLLGSACLLLSGAMWLSGAWQRRRYRLGQGAGVRLG